jgi:hypothetical protein
MGRQPCAATEHIPAEPAIAAAMRSARKPLSGLGRSQTRITYYIASGRRIVLLAVFAKQRQRERREIDRAWRAMQRCIAEGHVVEEDDR